MLERIERLLGLRPEDPKAAGTEVEYPPDFSPEDVATCRAVREFTMTSPERVAALCNAVRYVARAGVPGDVVECGVWRGGSMMAIARTLMAAGDTERHLHLFDTFEGMPPPSDEDVNFSGLPAEQELRESDKSSRVWAIATLDDVTRAVGSVGYPHQRIRYVAGRVEDTIPRDAPERISLLRLDTDWYESTKHELVHLFPRLSAGGVLIIDDYGHWQGARKATDEYLAEAGVHLLLNRIDYTGRIALKPG
jgi:O-methyltransferase